MKRVKLRPVTARQAARPLGSRASHRLWQQQSPKTDPDQSPTVDDPDRQAMVDQSWGSDCGSASMQTCRQRPKWLLCGCS